MWPKKLYVSVLLLFMAYKHLIYLQSLLDHVNLAFNAVGYEQPTVSINKANNIPVALFSVMTP